MFKFQDLSVRRKLTWMSIVTSTLALLLASSAFLIYEAVTFRTSLVRNLTTHAQIIATNSVSAIVFNDVHAATDTLAALRAEPHIEIIRIYRPDGQVFASYHRSDLPANTTFAEDIHPYLAGQTGGHLLDSQRMVVFQPILSEGQPVGMVGIQADLSEMRDRVRKYAGISGLVLIISLIFGGIFSARLQRRISQPILDLVDVSRSISADKNYSLRVANESRDELGLLANAFNEMLARIEERNVQLSTAYGTLERRVDERTEQLRRENEERKRLEEQLRSKNTQLEVQNKRVQEATRLKSEFLANMSHELRTPLNAIIGFSEVMYDGQVGTPTEPQRECLSDILTSSRHLLQLINDVLDLSKIEAGKMEFHPEPIDIERLVSEMRDVLRALAAKKRIQIVLDIDHSLTDIVIDPSKLKQVMYNYLSNALKFTPEEGRVVIRVKPDGAADFCVEVEDTGIGIRAEDVARLFVEFQQLDSTSAKKYPGTGLGLALTKRIVEAQGGRYGVRSEMGKGSVFYAVLPRVSTGMVHEPAPTAFPTPVPNVRSDAVTTGPRVLVIEDDANERNWMVRILTGAGYQVQTAATGVEGLARAREQRFDEITLDLLLPDLSGWDVLRSLRRGGINRNTPVIVVTVVAEKGIGSGFAIRDFLVKPVRPEDLLESLRKARTTLLPDRGRTVVENATPVPERARPILIIDDDPKSLALMELNLRQLGYAAVFRADGQSGLEALAEERPCAIVLDLTMPRMDGFEFLEQLRTLEQGKRLPVIVWTGKDLTAEEQRRLRKSAQAIVYKGQSGTQALLRELRAHLPPPPVRVVPDESIGRSG